jgi:exonuclease SbcC
MKFAHIADTHIKNLKYHDEYNQIFNQMYDTLRKEKIDYIIHCGDIAHTKTQISPEFVDMASKFFKNLADIAPTYVILGNHDGNLKNDSRQDAISPIINALSHKNLYLMKDSGEFHIDEQFCLNTLSIFDESNWVKPSDRSKINIALYHGAISGVETDIGYKLEHGDHDISIFNDYDFAFLGDIHKTNQILDKEGRIRYPGSTVQQNFGETDDKGFLIWNIEGKNSFSCQHYVIKNPKPFFTIEIDENGEVPEVIVPSGSRIRVVSKSQMAFDKVKKATDIVKNKYSPESVTFITKNNAVAVSDDKNSDDSYENLRDLGVQERLIREYTKQFNLDEDVLNKVLDLNKNYSLKLEENEEILRNINWKLKSLEWDNLFNYGEGNKINFEDLNGIVGIFGKNYSGKSSIIDSLLYTVYNTTSKNNRKNLNVINQNKEKAFGKVQIEIDDEVYEIERRSEKYTKKLKGVTTTEAKTDVEFKTDGESLNGLARNDTDKSIKRFFGTVDDFFLTSMASQFGYLSFIGEGSTKRKEIIAKFLDLENFEKKFKMAKEDSADIKGLLKKLEGNNYDRDIAVAELELTAATNSVKESSNLLISLRNKLQTANDNLCEVNKLLANISETVVDINKLTSDLDKAKKAIVTLTEENKNYQFENEKMLGIIKKADELLLLISDEDINKTDKELEELNTKIAPLEKEIVKITSEISASKVKLKLLEDVPCGDMFPSCKFIKDAFEAKDIYADLDIQYNIKSSLLSRYNTKYDKLDEKNANLINKRAQVTKKRADSHQTYSTNELKIQKNLVLQGNFNKIIEENTKKIKEYDENCEAIENYERLLEKKTKLTVETQQLSINIKNLDIEIIDLYKKEGSAQQKIEMLNKQKHDLENLRKEYSAYDVYQSCMHSSGISYEIIKSKLPIINDEIAKIMSNIVEFSIYLENDDDKLDIMIKHPKYDARPLEMGSGAEKTLASTAIRLALLNVTTLPKGDIFILDEPGTALDQENLDGFIKILELIKTYFKTVIMISHLDSLKDCVDKQIIIDKIDGYAYVNQ